MSRCSRRTATVIVRGEAQKTPFMKVKEYAEQGYTHAVVIGLVEIL